MELPIYNGVRAEPRFLRDPTSLESISSGISKISSYVASNLSKRRPTMIPNVTIPTTLFEQQQQQQQQQFLEEIVTEEEQVIDEDRDMDTITFASFDKLNKSISCLLLGYQDGFQLWDITSPDNVHEVCSIRDKETFGTVSCIHLLNQTSQDTFLVIVTEKNKKSKIVIYSLKTYSIIKQVTEPMDEHSLEDDTVLVTCIKSNHKIIALGCLSRHKSSIHFLSAIDFKSVASPLFDVYHDINVGPVFTLGSRFIAYATNAAVLNSDPVMTSFSNKLQVEKDVKGAAKDIAKEVVSGMKSLGEFSYHRLSNYFGNNYPMSTAATAVPSPLVPSSISPVPMNADKEVIKKIAPSGMVMIRDIHKLPSLPTRNLSNSTIAHFRPHTHPISCLTFNQSGTLLLSASKQGHTFHVFSILTNTRSSGNVSHLYSLSRGFTDAQVVDCQFSNDSNWCAISTARGTTHVYAINPYGGKPEISGHVHSKVNNNSPVYHHSIISKMKPKVPSSTSSSTTPTTLGSVARIKQRRRMPEILNQEEMYINNNYGPTPPRHPSSLPPPIHLNRLQKEPRAKLTTSFVNASKSPYFVNSDVYKTDKDNNNTTISIKQQATNMLKHIPYLPQQQQQPQSQSQQPASDTLMFGFDEEYDDVTKMMNDEIGYQDIYTFHPSGILTLHRCWIAKIVVKKRENGRNLEKLDLSLKKESIAEWKVARNSDWDTVQTMIDDEPLSVQEKKKKSNRKLFWLSNAEITTYPLDEPPIWSHRQFLFQTFKSDSLKKSLKSGVIPTTDTLVMPKEMPEPVSSRIDRVRKTTTRITNGAVEENMDDALAELEDNLSKAMQTSFSPTESISNSPATTAKWLSTSANAIPGASSSKSSTDKNSSVSFENAYLINMGSGPSPEPSMHGSTPMQHSSLIQLDDDIRQSLEEDTIRFESDTQLQNDLYSPDGDNEVAYPYESIFEGFHMQQDSDSFHWH